jgi:CheY-like chemotaxis protein
MLIVDDDRAQRNLVAQILADRGYDVDTASNGFEALELASRRPYELAVLDYQMPGMDGVELFQRLKELHPDIVGIFVTAYTTLDTVYPAITAGVERVLAKPVDAAELVQAVEELAGAP